jgi:hypothetical protein
MVDVPALKLRDESNLSPRIVVPFSSRARISRFDSRRKATIPCGILLCRAFIPMVQATESRMRKNAAPSRRANSATGGLLP